MSAFACPAWQSVMRRPMVLHMGKQSEPQLLVVQNCASTEEFTCAPSVSTPRLAQRTALTASPVTEGEHAPSIAHLLVVAAVQVTPSRRLAWGG